METFDAKRGRNEWMEVGHEQNQIFRCLNFRSSYTHAGVERLQSVAGEKFDYKECYETEELEMDPRHLDLIPIFIESRQVRKSMTCQYADIANSSFLGGLRTVHEDYQSRDDLGNCGKIHGMVINVSKNQISGPIPSV